MATIRMAVAVNTGASRSWRAAARAYSAIAPAASHALHMTSHIFVAMGMWDDVVAANEGRWCMAPS